MPGRKPFFSPLKHHTFRNMWLATMVSNLGVLIQAVGAAWMMTNLSASENMVALVQGFTTLPIMMFSIIAGAIADSYDRRQVLLVAQVFMFIASLALSVFAYLGLVTPWTLLGFTFLLGVGTALNNPAWQASIGDLVPREDLSGGVSLNAVAMNITRGVGPALGGFIVALGGGAAAFAVNAVTYIAPIIALSRWKGPKKDKNPLPREPLGRAVSAGLRYVAMSPNLLKVFFRTFLFGISSIAILALLPVVARVVVQGGPLTFGLMLGAFGIGAVGGAMLNARLRESLSSENIIRLCFAVFALCEAIIGVSANVLMIGTALIVAGACWVIALSLFNTIIQLSTPRWVVGRALSFYQTMAFGGMAAGSWIWGMVAEAGSIETAFSIAAVTMGAGVIVGIFLPMPAVETLDLDPLNRFKHPDLELDILPRSGPVVVQVDYDIADNDLEAFLDLMAERRRIRIRDGARNWALMRDLEIPEQWTETYHVATWVDYVRHVQRRTQADADNIDQLWALHRGEGQPKIHRMIERQAIRSTDEIFHQHHQVGPGPH